MAGSDFDKRQTAKPFAANAALVLVVGKSPVNRLVVSKIVERSGLTVLTNPPETAVEILTKERPGLVILDGGADGRDCEPLMEGIATQRKINGRPVPAVIMLSTRIGTPESLSLGACIDAVVSKPILPETLQPVVDDLVRRTRD